MIKPYIELFSSRPAAKADLLNLHYHNPRRYPFLFESSACSHFSCLDYLFAFPAKSITASDNNFLSLLAAELAANQAAASPQIPFVSGWLVFLAYELNREIEPVLQKQDGGANHCFNSFAVRIDGAVVRNRKTGQIFAAAKNKSMLAELKRDLLASVNKTLPKHQLPGVKLAEEDARLFLDRVAEIKRYIEAGDVFQVNLSRLWQGCFAREVSPAELYHNLRAANPAPFSALAAWDNKAIISSSPERLISVRGETIETSPIAGTRKRGANLENDRNLSRELLSHFKEQAEHIMLVDLERNDIGRVCRPGTVKVTSMMKLETFAHVHHLVSNVQGKLNNNINPVDVIRAVFPGGTITGCPKVRCMEIINQLEADCRGAYTGSIGFIDDSGDLDFNILIRTIEMEENNIRFRTGAGIVYDSIAEMELKETRNKALGLLKALKS